MSLTDDEYWKLGSFNLEQHVKDVNRIIECLPEPRRSQIRKMMDSIGDQFMTAPASTRRAYHAAYPCGLVKHSLEVTNLMFELVQKFGSPMPDHKIGFVGLFHDIGKSGTKGRPYYIQADDWKRKRSEFWEVDRDQFMPAPDKSLFVLQHYGVTLDRDEWTAIRLAADYRSVDEWRWNEPDLAMLLATAKDWQTRREKATER